MQFFQSFPNSYNLKESGSEKYNFNHDGISIALPFGGFDLPLQEYHYHMTLNKINWKMIERERRLMMQQCLDGAGGFSPGEMNPLPKADQNAAKLLELYRKKYAGQVVNIYGHKNLQAYFAFAQENTSKAILEILKKGNNRHYKLNNLTLIRGGRGTEAPQGRPRRRIFHLGVFAFKANNLLSINEIRNLAIYLKQSFNRLGVLFRGKDIKIQINPFTNSGRSYYKYEIQFPIEKCRKNKSSE